MRKRPIVVVVLILLCVYSYVKQNMLVKRLDGIKQNSAIVSLVNSNTRETSDYTGLLNVAVGGYTPPAPVQDAETQARIDELVALNRPWTAQAQQEEARKHIAVPPQRLGDVLKAGFTANSVAISAYVWLRTRMYEEYDPTFHMKNNQDLLEGIPSDMMTQFRMAGSRGGAERIRENIIKSLVAEKSLADAGAVGLGAGFFAGIMDVDVLIIILFTLFGLPHLTKRFCRSDCKG
jgi:hypothetical protein